jgi:geranylgeranyl diphosphate synthase type I
MRDARAVSSDLRDRVEAALREFMMVAIAPLRQIDDELVPVAEALAEFVLDGGKRLRPSFCFWAARAAGLPDSESLVRAAASLELLQASALVHDDVIDHSDTRRGQPAMHRRFAEIHRARDWAGSSDEFGAGAAILIGDLLLAWSETLLATSGFDAAARERARPISDVMRLELMAGQYLDVVEQARGGTSVESALRVARFKSAKYTIERPLHLGAVLADAPTPVITAYSEYGIPLGEAFQLRDDLLGVFGDPGVTGKPAGGDLREGKRTVLIALAVERLASAEAAALQAGLGNPGLSDAEVARLRNLIAESGAAAQVESMIVERADHALAALARADLDPTGRDALVALALAATQRAD